MKALEKSRQELVELHDKLCDQHDELIEEIKKTNKKKYKLDNMIQREKLYIKLKQIEGKIDVLSDAIDSIDAKKHLYKEMPKAELDTTKPYKQYTSSESVKKSMENMREVIDKEYQVLDTLIAKRTLAYRYSTERRKGISKYDFGPIPLLGGVIAIWTLAIPYSAITNLTFSLSTFLPGLAFTFALGAAAATIIKTKITNKKIETFKTVNETLGEDKLDLINNNSMQESYDLDSKINKKIHDIMTMETIYKEQERAYEEAKEYESKNNSQKSLKTEPSFIETRNRQQYDEYGNPICNTGRWAGYADIPSDYPSKILVEGSSRTERDDTIEMGVLYRHLEDDDFKLSFKK